MSVTLVSVQVLPNYLEEFLEATRINHEASVQEPGNLRFDVLQSSQDPCNFLLYEAYISPQAAAAHKQTAHYFRWRETVAPFMAKPRQGIPYQMLHPSP